MAWNPDLLKRLSEHAVPFAIVGGVAAIIHGSPRITEDLNVCAPLDHGTAVRIIRAFQGLSPIWRMRKDLPVIQEDSSNLHHLKNMYLHTTLGQIDILGELPGVGNYNDLQSHIVKMVFQGIPCQVIDVDTLIKSKEFAARPKDKQDLRTLMIIREKLGTRQ